MTVLKALMAISGESDVAIVRSTITRIVSAVSGTLNPPTGAVYMRVAAIGGGGGVNSYSGWLSSGGGGGCAASKIVTAAPITYTVGAGGSYATDWGVSSNGKNTTATFGAYSLIGEGGKSGSSASGGVGSGGDYNFSGGAGAMSYSGYAAGGGGAAGPNGDGGKGNTYTINYSAAAAGSYSGTGWGDGGGGGGLTAQNGGGGTGAAGGFDIPNTSSYGGTPPIVIYGNSAPGPFGADAYSQVHSSSAPASEYYPTGGVCGGGASSYVVLSGSRSVGGVGGLIVEYFYTS